MNDPTRYSEVSAAAPMPRACQRTANVVASAPVLQHDERRALLLERATELFASQGCDRLRSRATIV